MLATRIFSPPTSVPTAVPGGISLPSATWIFKRIVSLHGRLGDIIHSTNPIRQTGKTRLNSVPDSGRDQLVIPILDELDVRIFRAILTGNLSAPFSTRLRASLQEVARRLRADDMTVRNRLKRFQEEGFVSGWILLPNPSLFGYRMTVVIVDASPGPKEDMLNELRLVQGVVAILD